MITQDKLTPQNRLRAWLTRELDRLQNQHALTGESPSGRGIASAMLDAWHWLDTSTGWEDLAGRVTEALRQAASSHSSSVAAGDEDFWAYARADGFYGVQYAMERAAAESSAR